MTLSYKFFPFTEWLRRTVTIQRAARHESRPPARVILSSESTFDYDYEKDYEQEHEHEDVSVFATPHIPPQRPAT